MSAPTPSKHAYLYALGAVLLWSTVATAFKLSLRHLSPDQLLAGSALVSTLALAFILALRGQLREALRPDRDQLRRSLLGLLNPLLYYLVLFEAYRRLPAQQAQPLNYTWAITLSLLAVPLLGQRLRWQDGLALLLGWTGVAVISTRGELLALQLDDPIGVALALGSTVIWALYWLWSAKDPRAPVVALFQNFCVALPPIWAWSLWRSGPVLPSTAGLLGATYVGLFEMGFTFVLWLLAMRHAPSAARVGALIFLSPFLSLVLIHHLLDETIHPATLAGLVLIVIGLQVQRMGKN